MSVESLIDYLSSIIKLSPAFIDDFKSGLEGEQYKPHQVIHSAGQVENRIWYIETGLARSYYFDQAGKEHTLNFYRSNDIVFSYKGFWKEAADYYVEIMAPTTLISLPYESLYKLIEQYEEIKTLINIFTRQRYYEELFKSRLMTWPAKERYSQFRKANPDIFKLVSVKLIASYLNMTRENLSRIIGRDS